MFTEALGLVNDFEETLERLKASSASINRGLVYYIRKTVLNLVEIKGREGYIKFIPLKSDLSKLFYAGAQFLHKGLINNKIRYVKELFNLVSDSHVFEFFNDLQSGLDDVVDQWDGSELDPRADFFRFPPQRIKKRVIYWNKWSYDD